MRCIALALALLALPAKAQDPAVTGGSREITLRDGETATVRMVVADPSKNLLSVVTLPETIQDVISAWDGKDLSVEHAGNKLFLKLLSKTEGHLDVITSAGHHYRLLLAPSADAGYDSNVVILRKEQPAPTREIAGTASGAIDFIRAMRIGEVPPDATVRSGKNQTVFTSDDLEATVVWTYETARFRGYVLRLANKSAKEAYHVDVTRFASDRLVLIGARDLVVLPGKTTRLYLVFWK